MGASRRRGAIGSVITLKSVHIIIGDLLQAKVDLATVQQMAGHASPLTTVRYDRRGDEARREAVEHLHFPYTRRGKP